MAKDRNKLTPKQRLFVAEYLFDLNATQAAIRAGYSKKTANEQGAQNLAKLSIQAALLQARNSIEKKEEKALLTAREVEEKLDMLINQNPLDYYEEDGFTFKNMKKLTREQAYALNEIATIETPLGSHFKVKFEGKRSAIELKMKRLGLLVDKHEVEGTMIVRIHNAVKEKAKDAAD